MNLKFQVWITTQIKLISINFNQQGLYICNVFYCKLQLFISPDSGVQRSMTNCKNRSVDNTR